MEEPGFIKCEAEWLSGTEVETSVLSTAGNKKEINNEAGLSFAELAAETIKEEYQIQIMEEVQFIKCEPYWPSDRDESSNFFQEADVQLSTDNREKIKAEIVEEEDGSKALPCDAEINSTEQDIPPFKGIAACLKLDEDIEGDLKGELNCENSITDTNSKDMQLSLCDFVEVHMTTPNTMKRTKKKNAKTKTNNLSCQVNPKASEETDGKVNRTCPLCGKHFKTNYLLKKHSSIHHVAGGCEVNMAGQILVTFDNSVRETSKVDGPTVSIKQYSCSICFKFFSKKSNLTAHELIHKGNRAHSCSSCGSSFIRRNDLRRHMSSHNGHKPHQCFVCNKYFSSPYVLKRHMLIHSPVRTHSCNSCGKMFRLRSHLNSHLLTHTEQRPHECKFCGKSFTLWSYFQKHTLTHTRLYPYSCASCGEVFSDQSDFDSHMSTHACDKPHVCSTCGMAFLEQLNLSKHNLVHTKPKPYACKTCGAEFTHLPDLNRHKLVHNGQKPYLCTSCGKGFFHQSHLGRHLLIHARENDQPSLS